MLGGLFIALIALDTFCTGWLLRDRVALRGRIGELEGKLDELLG